MYYIPKISMNMYYIYTLICIICNDMLLSCNDIVKHCMAAHAHVVSGAM